MVFPARLIRETKSRQPPAAAAHVSVAIVRRSIQVALIIGPTLLWANHGPLFILDPALDYHKATLMFCVPFIVSLVSGIAARIEASFGRR